MPLIYCCIFLFILYALLITYFTLAWQAIPVFQPQPAAPLKLSVVVPARNEEKHIGALLKALQQQTHPASHTEIIVVDDESTDDTAAIIKSFTDVKYIRVQHQQQGPAYKKRALTAGIKAATSDHIVCTDADCIPGPEWLSSFSSCIQRYDPAFIAAPVRFSDDHSLLGIFQSLDFMILQGITGAAVHKGSLAMSNGANLAYSKKAFEAVDGFNGIDHIASGDDMLLMQKMKMKFPGRIQYLRSEASVTETEPMQNWRAFFNQRIRWASKATVYSDAKIKAVLLLVYLFNLSFVVLAVAAIINPAYARWLAGCWIAKTIVEFPFMIAVSRFFHRTRLMKYFFFFQPLHILYTVLSGTFSQFGQYEWKGRRVR